VAIELQEPLLAREREPDSREGAIITCEVGLVAFVRVLMEVCMERDASHARADAVQRDFFSQEHNSSSRSKQLSGLGRALEER
jgi:hypothetical protein